MSDYNTNNNGNSSPSSVASQIDAMVAAAGARVEHSNVLTGATGTQGHVIISADGSARVIGEVTAPDRVQDSGMDLNHARAQSEARMAALAGKINEQRFDPITGERIHVLQGRARELAEMQFATEANAHFYSETRYQAIEAQRERDVAFRDAEADERLAMLRVTGGNPAKLARLNELLGDEELQIAAKAMLAARFERGRG